ncbi:hypothetical protein QUT12_22560, partial [Xanthomonas citri pv. citri]
YGAEWKNVAAQMSGRSIEACKQAYNSHVRQRRLAEAAPSVAASPKRLKSWQDRRDREKAAEQERARALALAQQRSTTAEWLGDPLPGRSALDKKRDGISDPEYFDRRHVHVPKKPTLYTGGQNGSAS